MDTHNPDGKDTKLATTTGVAHEKELRRSIIFYHTLSLQYVSLCMSGYIRSCFNKEIITQPQSEAEIKHEEFIRKFEPLQSYPKTYKLPWTTSSSTSSMTTTSSMFSDPIFYVSPFKIATDADVDINPMDLLELINEILPHDNIRIDIGILDEKLAIDPSKSERPIVLVLIQSLSYPTVTGSIGLTTNPVYKIRKTTVPSLQIRKLSSRWQQWYTQAYKIPQYLLLPVPVQSKGQPKPKRTNVSILYSECLEKIDKNSIDILWKNFFEHLQLCLSHHDEKLKIFPRMTKQYNLSFTTASPDVKTIHMYDQREALKQDAIERLHVRSITQPNLAFFCIQLQPRPDSSWIYSSSSTVVSSLGKPTPCYVMHGTDMKEPLVPFFQNQVLTFLIRDIIRFSSSDGKSVPVYEKLLTFNTIRDLYGEKKPLALGANTSTS